VDERWTWADLDADGVALLRETERALGSDVVVAYRRGVSATVGAAGVGMPPAPLDDSQIECLRGVEDRLGCVAVAYGH